MPLGGSPWMPPKPHDAFGRAPVSEQRSRTAVGRFVATDSYRLPLLHLPRIDLTASTSETTGTRLRMEAPLDVPSRNSASHLGLPPSLTCVVLERARDSKVRTTDQCSSRSKDRPMSVPVLLLCEIIQGLYCVRTTMLDAPRSSAEEQRS